MSTPSQFKGCNPSELAIGLDSLPPFAAFGTVGSKQEDVAVAFVSSLAAPAATSSSAMRAATKVAAAASSSCSALLAALASLVVPTAATVASATDAHGSSIKEPPVRQRTELSDALSVASATDAHGSLIEDRGASSEEKEQTVRGVHTERYTVRKSMKHGCPWQCAVAVGSSISAATKMSQRRANFCLLEAKREHMKSQCTKDSKLKHGVQTLTLFSPFGNPWTIHVLQRGTEVYKGH